MVSEVLSARLSPEAKISFLAAVCLSPGMPTNAYEHDVTAVGD
jgi:hypothetical protein